MTLSRDEAITLAKKTLASQGGRQRAEAVEALVDALLRGEAPKTYAERFVQMAIQRAELRGKEDTE